MKSLKKPNKKQTKKRPNKNPQTNKQRNLQKTKPNKTQLPKLLRAKVENFSTNLKTKADEGYLNVGYLKKQIPS